MKPNSVNCSQQSTMPPRKHPYPNKLWMRPSRCGGLDCKRRLKPFHLLLNRLTPHHLAQRETFLKRSYQTPEPLSESSEGSSRRWLRRSPSDVVPFRCPSAGSVTVTTIKSLSLLSLGLRQFMLVCEQSSKDWIKATSPKATGLIASGECRRR